MWEIEEHVELDPPKQSRYGRALLLSVAAHLALIAWLSTMQTNEKSAVVNKASPAVVLRLLPSLATPVEEEPAVLESPPPPLSPAPEAPPAQENLVDVPQVPRSFDFQLPTQADTATAPSAPSTMQLRQLVDSFIGSDTSTPDPRCSAQQQYSELFDCPRLAQPIGDSSQSEFTYEFFSRTSRNTAQAQQRAQQFERLAGSLSDSGLSAGQVDAFMHSIDIQRQEQSTSTDARLSTLRDGILRNDATHQIKKRVLNP